MRNIVLAGSAVAVAIATVSYAAAPAKQKAPATATSVSLAASNPLARPSSLPFQAPDFAHIKDADYLPAI
jgi:peptidyl-dipeptidase Dcp